MLHYACKSRQMEVAKLLLERMTRDAVLSLNHVSIGWKILVYITRDECGCIYVCN